MSGEETTGAILVVNPNPDERKALTDALTARGRDVEGADSIQEALQVLSRRQCDAVVSVRTLPDGSGELLAQQAAEIAPAARVILVTNFSQVKSASDLLRFDFTDYILDVDDLAGLTTGSQRGPSPNQRQLVECFLRTVEAVVGLLELSDPLTAGNAASALRLAEGICREMGLSDERRQEVGLASLLHDIGNFAMRPGVLTKPDCLDSDEEDQVRQHTLRGVQLIDHIEFPWRIKPIIRHHHERYDGTGYPDSKKGRAIPIGSRILAVVDTYLSMTSSRPHRKPLTPVQAIQEIRNHVGTQFDPEVVEAFNAYVERRRNLSGEMFQVKVLVQGSANEPLSRLKLQFLREDFKVLSAASTQEALELVEKEDVRFLVADVTSSWEEALQVLEGLQGRIDTSQTDVVFLDGENSRERRVTALDNGAEEVFPLDVGGSEVISRLRRILRKEEAVKKRSSQDGEQAGIEGDLAQMNLPEILQMLSMGQKTARIQVEAPKVKGSVWLETGRLTHAESAKLKGPPALSKLVAQERGRFRIHHGSTSSERTVDRDAMSVLLDILKEQDEDARDTATPAR